LLKHPEVLKAVAEPVIEFAATGGKAKAAKS
jgi:hypothetical protein